MKCRLGQVMVCTTLLTLASCLPEERVVWSPDGQWAALRAVDGLRICDVDGELSELLAEHVRAMSWFPDSRRLVYVQERKITNWEEIRSAFVGPSAESLERIRDMAHLLREEFLAFDGDPDDFESEVVDELSEGEIAAAILYVRDEKPEGVREKFGEKWECMDNASADIVQLRVATYDGERLVDDRALVTQLSEMTDPRVSPHQTAIAYVSHRGHDLGDVMVVPVDGSSAPRNVAELTAVYVDWSPDGQWLAYARTKTPGGDDGDLRLGVVERRRVCGDSGALLDEFDGPDELAGTAFQIFTKVRYLPDERVMFAALEMNLPCVAADMPEDVGLFAVDLRRQPTVVRLLTRSIQRELGEGTLWYAVSPDGQRVCVPGEDGQVFIVHLATGNVAHGLADEHLCGGMDVLPTWRSNDELCVAAETDQNEDRGELVRLRVIGADGHDDRTPIVLSSEWPDEAVHGILLGDDESGSEEDENDDCCE